MDFFHSFCHYYESPIAFSSYLDTNYEPLVSSLFGSQLMITNSFLFLSKNTVRPHSMSWTTCKVTHWIPLHNMYRPIVYIRWYFMLIPTSCWYRHSGPLYIWPILLVVELYRLTSHAIFVPGLLSPMGQISLSFHSYFYLIGSIDEANILYNRAC